MSDTRVYNYVSYKPHGMEDIAEIATILSNGWVFRGQSNSSWNISSSLEREANRHGNRHIQKVERQTLKEIKQNSSVDLGHKLKATDDFSWLALLQHYGCNTRLVDFTESFDIALFFAVNELRENHSAVWAISKRPLDDAIVTMLKLTENTLTEDGIKEMLVNKSLTSAAGDMDSEQPFVIHGKPKESNDRLVAQQGLFLCPLQINSTFMENITKALHLTGKKEPVPQLSCLEDLKSISKQNAIIKFVICKDLQRSILCYLKTKNITEATLFPGLDGFARSLNYYTTGLE